ncbi:MAG: BLUF domain-containing protein [Sphingomonas sp.]|uniref:BLUF domain-containing protein n=1 Tax=Sphingomonas sp. TaxID=28214 RepID=UPI003F7ECA0C
MRQIIYRSTSTADTRRAVDEIPGILRQAVARNGVDGITGLLYTQDDAFLQAIEGPPESMTDLLARLYRDDRHRELQILVDRPVEHREFGDWTMIHRDRRESIDAFDDRLRVLLAGVSDETVEHFRALQPA